jgi:hypothetical protein
MKRYAFIVILSVNLFLAGCTKDNNFMNAYIQNPTSYLLTKEEWTGPSSNGESFFFFYNDYNLVTKVERCQWGTVSVNGGPAEMWYDTADYFIEYSNGLASKVTMEEGGSLAYLIYEYDNGHLPTKRTIYLPDGSVQQYSSYTYNDSDNLTEKIDYKDADLFRYEFTYNGDNNLTSVTDYILWSNPQQKMKYEWSDFDDKVNWIKTVNGLPPTFVWDNNFGAYSSSSPSNNKNQNYFPPIDINQPFDNISFSPVYCSYEYNDEDLPTKMYSGPWVVLFEYEKYK